MGYCLDANVFIQAHRTFYAFDIVPSFWKALIQHAQNGDICSPLAVYDELTSQSNDELSKWAKTNREDIFEEPDESVSSHYARIADYAAKNYEIHQVNEFLNGADPWVIAHALKGKHTVVTQELPKEEKRDAKTGLIPGKIKLPNMCQFFGVTWMGVFELMRNLNIKI